MKGTADEHKYNEASAEASLHVLWLCLSKGTQHAHPGKQQALLGQDLPRPGPHTGRNRPLWGELRARPRSDLQVQQ